jgi:hypothetical protein
MQDFYSTVASLSFTLMGLWWAVVQFRHEEWIPRYRGLVYSVFLSFLVPGTMGLAAQIDLASRWVWQLSFVLAAGFGIAAMIGSIRVDADDPGAWILGPGRTVTIGLYALVALVALLAEPIADATDGDFSALQVEAALVTLLMFLGVNLAFAAMAMPKTAAPPDGAPSGDNRAGQAVRSATGNRPGRFRFGLGRTKSGGPGV